MREEDTSAVSNVSCGTVRSDVHCESPQLVSVRFRLLLLTEVNGMSPGTVLREAVPGFFVPLHRDVVRHVRSGAADHGRRSKRKLQPARGHQRKHTGDDRVVVATFCGLVADVP